jgi:hypothetical protein
MDMIQNFEDLAAMMKAIVIEKVRYIEKTVTFNKEDIE